MGCQRESRGAHREVLGMINGFTGLLVLPLIVLAKDSREQASLITGRLWGEVRGAAVARTATRSFTQ